MAVTVTNTSGTIIDGGSVNITGSGFGTGPSNVEWLGGSGGNIESGTVGIKELLRLILCGRYNKAAVKFSPQTK